MKLKLAVQKSGRLLEDSLKLLNECGFRIDNHSSELKINIPNFDLEILFLRNSDIPNYLEQGVVDVAILGENLLEEKDANELIIFDKLGFSKCRLSLASKVDFKLNSATDLMGKTIATSYPNSLRKYLLKNNIEAKIHVISGSVEIAPNIGLSDAICDIVSTGDTLFKNGLEEKIILFKSEAVLVANKNSIIEKQEIFEAFTFRINSVLKARQNRYILFNIPNIAIEDAAKLLPGLKSPTILPLFEKGWSSMHSVIEVNDIWHVLKDIREIGAEGILIIPIEKMII